MSTDPGPENRALAVIAERCTVPRDPRERAEILAAFRALHRSGLITAADVRGPLTNTYETR